MTRALAALALAALLLTGCTPAPTPTPPAPAPTFPSPQVGAQTRHTTQPSKPTPKPRPTTHATRTTHAADPTHDIGAGTPGAFCATSRLGKRFTKNGVTYECRGPKPYRWRRI